MACCVVVQEIDVLYLMSLLSTSTSDTMPAYQVGTAAERHLWSDS